MYENSNPTPPQLPMPSTGGSWVRNPDGSLSREPGTEPVQPDANPEE